MPVTLSTITTPMNLIETAEVYRTAVSQQLDPTTRVELGQFLTPSAVATFMASLFAPTQSEVTLLDPGAGVGTLTAAFIEQLLGQGTLPASITVDAYELDKTMLAYLEEMAEQCRLRCQDAAVPFMGQVIHDDFITSGADQLWNAHSLFGATTRAYTHCIMNPPYRKMRSDSPHRQQLRQIGVETSNLYSAFVAIAVKLLAPQGQLVAIIPRSFCNGVYFKPFRQLLLAEMSIEQIHIFTSRREAFKDDDVLQENIILHAVKHRQTQDVMITSSSDPSFSDMTYRKISVEQLVKPDDSDQVIHIAASDFDQLVLDRIRHFSCSLNELGLSVSTGPVVDFRLKDDLCQQPEQHTVPLIYPNHFHQHQIQWPDHDGKKPNAIRESVQSSRWLMPNGWYVLTRRFSSTEEKRRIVAAVHNPTQIPGEKIGFENHINVFHAKKSGLDATIAKGLTLYLNSTLVDLYFRQFSGHTQVNATDLRMLNYPDLATLQRLGEQVDGTFPDQKAIDASIDREIDHFLQKNGTGDSPMLIQQKIQEALIILDEIGMPCGQRNERSALTLLALLGLKPDLPWEAASAPLVGITPIMDFAKEHYGRAYAPNTRETFRRQTMHQFVDAGIVLPNPDEPTRAVNSPKWVYQIEPSALALLRTFGSPAWEANLEQYLRDRQTLAERYAQKREMLMIPLVFGEKQELYLTPGNHSQLIHAVIEQFGPRFAPGAEVLYIGDTGAKMGYFAEKVFQELGLTFDSHGKFPDVVLYYRAKNWLFLIEAVTSHGPINAKRHHELATLFSKAAAGLVYVTTFPTQQMMSKYLSEISWETEVWVAETPTHLIHFDGEQFLGPYQ